MNSATPSWCLWAGAISAGLWLVFYWVSDVRPIGFVARPFAIAGENVLLAYLLSDLFPSLLNALHLGGWYGRLAEPYLACAVLRSAGCAVVILAITAGLNRLGKRESIRQVLPAKLMCPAAGQGALAVEIRKDDPAVQRHVAFLDDNAARLTTTCERALLNKMGGGCQVPIGARARVKLEGQLLPIADGFNFLLAGVPLERVSMLLGHRSVSVTERHYAPWVRSRQEQLERDVKRTWSEDPIAFASTKGTPEVHGAREAVN